MGNVLPTILNMKQIIKCSLVAISALFVAVGCGGGSESGGDDNSSASQVEPTAPAATEFISLKVAGMT